MSQSLTLPCSWKAAPISQAKPGSLASEEVRHEGSNKRRRIIEGAMRESSLLSRTGRGAGVSPPLHDALRKPLSSRAPPASRRASRAVSASGSRGGRILALWGVSSHAGFHASSPGGGVMDKPSTAFPKFDVDKDEKTRKKKPPRYQVLLHNDEVNRREYVVKVLLKIVPTLTMDDAVNIMNEAHFNGMAAVIICAQEEAEEYCEGLRNNGLVSTVEPVGKGD